MGRSGRTRSRASRRSLWRWQAGLLHDTATWAALDFDLVKQRAPRSADAAQRYGRDVQLPGEAELDPAIQLHQGDRRGVGKRYPVSVKYSTSLGAYHSIPGALDTSGFRRRANGYIGICRKIIK